MALPQVAFYKFISAESSITNIVGTRIFPNTIPQSNTTYPAIRFAFISGTHDHHLSGASGILRARVQIDCYDKSFLGVLNLAEKVRLVLDGFNGQMNTETVHFSKLDGEQGIFEPSQDASDIGLHRQVLDFLIRFVIPQP